MKRETLKSRLGFILLSAGCAIGLGNVWKFPYMVGQGGGGIFVLMYIAFLVLMGLPILAMEFAIGRAAQRSPVRAYQELQRPGQYWHIHGYLSLIGCYLLMMFYVPVAGWILHYFYLTASGVFAGIAPEKVPVIFGSLLEQPELMLAWSVVVVALAVLACALGLQNGLERVTKVLMIALLFVMGLLAVNSLFMDGAAAGIKFYLVPDFERWRQVGIFATAVGAMKQAFFTLGLGVGAMLIFGSYIDRQKSLLGESVTIVALDTFVALASGLIIFPACATYNVDPAAGPPLIFITLPNIFGHMAMGTLWGSLFFLFMSFAAMSTVLTVFENLISCNMEMWDWSRRKSSLVNLFLMTVLSVPCILGFNVWTWDWLKIFGGTILDLEDFFLSNILLPVGAIIYVLFCTRRYGWGWENFKAEMNAGEGMRVADWTRGYVTYVLPVIVFFLFVYGIWEKFAG